MFAGLGYLWSAWVGSRKLSMTQRFADAYGRAAIDRHVSTPAPKTTFRLDLPTTRLGAPVFGGVVIVGDHFETFAHGETVLWRPDHQP